jgi:haloacetate dehalogenase
MRIRQLRIRGRTQADPSTLAGLAKRVMEALENPLPELFPGFTAYRLFREESELFWLSAGTGPPLLLLHGYPQTLAAWHRVASFLRGKFRLVIPDLRGYGRSRGPKPDATHRGYSKRAMAEDAFAIMQAMGCARFAVAGHDRGARVAYRLALDQPSAVEALALLDIVSTLDMWERMSMPGALRSYHWLFLAQPAPMPERLIGADPHYYLQHLLERWKGRDAVLDPRAVADYAQSFRQASTMEASCEDYRAGAGIDRELDLTDRKAGRRFDCRVLLIWARQYFAGQSPRPAWERWAKLAEQQVQPVHVEHFERHHQLERKDHPGGSDHNESHDDHLGGRDHTERHDDHPGGTHRPECLEDLCLDCGHFIAEEQPEACAEALCRFFLAARR